MATRLCRPLSRSPAATTAYDPTAARGVASTPAEWTPAQLQTGSRVFSWWALNETASILQNDDTPVTAAGQPIARMNDQTGSLRNWVKANGNDAKRATYQIDGNGNAYAEFDKVDDGYIYGEGGDIWDFNLEGLVAFAVQPTSIDNQMIFVTRGDPRINPQFGIDSGKYYISVRDESSVLLSAYATSVPSTAQPQIVMGYRQSGVMHIVVDGVTETSTAGALGPMTGATGAPQLGEFGNALVPFGGRKYSGIVVGGPTTADERAEITSWLARQCGRTL